MFNRILFQSVVGAACGASVGFGIAASYDKFTGKSYLGITPLWTMLGAFGGFCIGGSYAAFTEWLGEGYTFSNLQRAATKADTIFNDEKQRSSNKLGLFSSANKGAKEFRKNLLNSENFTTAKPFIISALKKNGSLWDYFSTEISFTNYFLIALRHENINAYRDIVGQTYGIKFVSGSIDLYRRDSRKKEVIFNDGFQLKPINTWNARKLHYAEPCTGAYGVSFSKKIPPDSYGNPEDYYIVSFSAKHNFLLIDIVESPRNQGKLTDYQLKLQEVNSLDNIPPEAVAYYVDENSFTFWNCTQNRKFSANAMIENEPKKNMGCY